MATGALGLVSAIADGGVAHFVDTSVTFTSGRLWEWKNAGAIKAYVDYAGVITAAGFVGPVNGAVGATTPAAGAFTTLSASGASTLHDVSLRDSGNSERTELVQTTTGGVLNLRNTAGDAVVTFDGRDGVPMGISTTKTASFAAGAVTTPSIAPTGDLNTGWWFPALDTIAASTAGVERLRITDAGNVGIGTVSPVSKLNVKQSASDINSGVHVTGASDGSFFSIYNDGSDWNLASSFPGVDGSYQDINFLSSGIERLTIKVGGNVGIGTTGPTALLHIGASTTARASLCLPHGTAPTSPVNGDIWTTTTAVFARINGATVQLAVV